MPKPVQSSLFIPICVADLLNEERNNLEIIPHLRPAEYRRSRLPWNRRTVNRAYGGVLSGVAVRESYDLSDFGCGPSDNGSLRDNVFTSSLLHQYIDQAKYEKQGSNRRNYNCHHPLATKAPRHFCIFS
ncbi:hypothetical protein RJ640_017542 [Escallonia rubra]|uniref:Uncharacterized protein n=1 Tax=Escallonia rubra TaxID=112253 RepID=A0AA88QYM4_9ASTE|nr:hypothetical protein RJ640_017542 [Escallonia rubra]